MINHQDKNLSNEIDRLANLTLKLWDIPGMSLSIVQQGKNLKVAGYGTTVRDGSVYADENTVFQIASITKCFIGLAISLLVEEGKFKWDQPIHEYYPELKFTDPFAQKNVTLKDLLSHRSGLPAVSHQAWRLWWGRKTNVKEAIERLGIQEPGCSFRSHFAYSNMGFVLASELPKYVYNIPLHQYCQEKIFTPLEMKRTNMSLDFLKEDKNVALPHKLRKFAKEPIDYNIFYNDASGINSCAADMAKWLNYCMSGASAITYTLKPQTVLEPEGILDPFSLPMWSIFAHEQKITNYGLGWMMYTLNNHVVLFHTGMIDGMQSIVALVPDKNLGISILTNAAIHLGAASLLNQLLDLLLDVEKKDWLQEGLRVTADYEKKITQSLQDHEERRTKNTSPSLPLNHYAGEYVHPAYGSICIHLDKDQLRILIPSHEEGPLQHSQYDEFQITEIPTTVIFPWLVHFKLSEDKSQVIGLSTVDLGYFAKK